VRDWAIFRGGTTRAPGSTLARLRELQDTLDQFPLYAGAVVRVTLNGDAKNLDTFGGAVNA